MGVILAAAGGAGFLTSFVLLRLNLESMAWRYPLAACVAYLAFLLLVGLWLRHARERTMPDVDPGDVLDALDLARSQRVPDGEDGKYPYAPDSGDRTPGFEIPDLDVDLDDAAIIIIPVAMAIACLAAALYILYIAPVLLAELLLEGLLLSGVYRRVRGIEPDAWYSVVFRRTYKPFVALALVLAGLGYITQSLVPDARSIGEVLGAYLGG